jgi:tRNA-2-methylthio-N6-dimethylallyladenosine synthase
LNKKLLYIETLGCAMNSRDSEHIIAELRDKKNYTLTDSPKNADLILINTCSVREKPVHKLFSEIGQYKKIKKPGAKIGVCGCTASHLGADIIKQSPSVSFVLGARNVSKISEIVDVEGAVEIGIDYDDTGYVFGSHRDSALKALVNISVGCDKECTFCIVPHTRGSEISIPEHIIIGEVRKAVESGVKEIHLLGQNVNNYGKSFKDKKTNFTSLLRSISEIEGVERIKFSSPHPLHADDEFIEEFAKNPKICKNMHFPLQAGSSKILKVMRRGYTKEWFLDKVAKIRALCPEATISTDIIVGFPGETDEDFADTLDVVQKCGFEFMFSFAYSPRPLTTAPQMDGQIDDETKSDRLTRLQAIQMKIQDEAHARNVGLTHEVLLENYQDGSYFAKSFNGFSVKIVSDAGLLGQTRNVKIISAGRHALSGEFI